MTTSIDSGVLSLSSSTRDEVRTPNGNLVALHQGTAGTIEVWFSSGAGTAWTQDTGATISGVETFLSLAEHGLYCDAAGFLHVSYIAANGGATKVAYRRGTLNGAQDTVTWSSPWIGGFLLVGDVVTGYKAFPSIVALAVGTDTKVHILHGADFSPTGQAAVYIRLNVTSGGTITQDVLTEVEVASAAGFDVNPNVMFEHTGDGVTPTTSPHLHMVWMGASSGSVGVLKYCRAAYSSGSWTLGTVRTLDSSVTLPAQVSAVFDGVRTVVAYAASAATVVEWVERNAADTTTTTRTPTAVSDAAVKSLSVAHDQDANAYLYVAGTTAGTVKWSKFTRSLGTFSAYTNVDAAPVPTALTVHARSSTEPGHAVDVHFLATTVKHDRTVAINYAPTAPTWVTADNQATDVAVNLVLDWVFTDPDVAYGDLPTAYALKRDIGGTVRWWDGTDWDAVAETFVTTANTTVSLASWGADGDVTHLYAVAQKDTAGLGSPGVYSSWLSVIPDAKVNPVVTGPAEAGTVTTATTTATWTSTDQSAFLVELLDSAGTTTLWSSGWMVDAGLRSFPIGYILADATTYRAAVTTKTVEGLASNRDTNTFTTSFSVPVAAVLTVTEDSPDGAITVAWDNPAGGEAVVSNDLFVRVAGGSITDGNRTTSERRIGTDLDPDDSYIDWAVGSTVEYEYMVRAWAANGTYTDSEWSADAIDGGGVDDVLVDAIDGGGP